GFLLSWPMNLVIVLVPLCLLLGTYLILRNIDHLGLRLAGLISIMSGIWAIGMVGFWLLDFLIYIVQSDLWPVVGIFFVFGWLALWYYSTKLYFRYASKEAEPAK
ncbi:MAG: hypothetical protein Q6364_12565, partial [Candidatus Hermodarchaeota archaeon]|nr:hypothetical protein [Candidatus Hermodarchaeota archaeon]